MSLPVAVVLSKHLVSGTFRLSKHSRQPTSMADADSDGCKNPVVTRPGWTLPTWKLHSILVGEHIANTSAEGEKISSSGDGEQYLWSGLRVVLFRDACERYWHALIGERPLAYVVLREDEADGSIEPALVTIDYDEATAYAETDGQVLTTDIPAELYQMMEAFVLEHYEPKEFKKRKRKKWKNAEHSDSLENSADDVWSAERRFRRRGYHE